MKRFSILLLYLHLLAVPAFAAAPPVIDAVTPDCMIPMDLPAPELHVSAHCEEGGTLLYQWYTAETADASLLTRIDGAQDASYTPPVLAGERYYCVEVRCSHDGTLSDSLFSRLISVSFEAPWYDLVIVSMPDKLEYASGEVLDLTGLRVDVFYSGGVFHSVDGEGLTAPQEPLDALGEQEIVVRFENGAAAFRITVHGAHVHEYGGWETTISATCTESGLRTRSCACGDTQSETISPKGHRWKGGQTCTVCGAKKQSGSSGGTSTSNKASTPAVPAEPAAFAQSEASVQPEAAQETITIRWRSPWHNALLFGGILIVVLLFVLLLFSRSSQSSKK